MTIKDFYALKISPLKWIVLFVLGFQLLSSCEPKQEVENTNKLIGEWVVTEILMDIGNGAGEFEPTDLNITLSFGEDRILTANGLLCGFVESEKTLMGEYSTVDSTIFATCQGQKREHTFTLKNEELIISSSNCREPCRAKLVRK